MAKKIRFPLVMGNGIEVRTLEELQENFSIEKVLAYYTDGKLITWLRDRYLDDIADAISELNKDDPDFTLKICNAFGVEYNEEVDMEALEEKNRKLSLLKQYTDKKDYFDVVDDIAFNQDELYDLLDEERHTIYLCGDKFSIPLAKKEIKYIGVNNPVILINSKEIIDFTEKNIELIDVEFDEAYQSLINNSKENDSSDTIAHTDLIDDFNNLRGDNLVSRLENEIKQETVLADKARYMLYQIWTKIPREEKNITLNAEEEIKKAAKNGYEAARIRCSINFGMYNEEYSDSTNNNVDNKAYRKHCCQSDYLDNIDQEDCFILYEVGVAYLCVDSSKAIEFIKKSAEMNCWIAQYSMGLRYDDGDGVTKNVSLANEWYKKAAQKGVALCYYLMAYNCLYVLNDEEKLGQEYVLKAFEDREYMQILIQDYERGINLADSPKYSSYVEFERFGSMYGTRNELINKLNQKFLKYFHVVKQKFTPNDNRDFDSFVNEYTNKYGSLLKNNLIFLYGNRKIESISASLREYSNSYKSDIYNILADLLTQYDMCFSLSDVNESDYKLNEWGTTGGFFSQTNYNGDCNFIDFDSAVRDRISEYNEAAKKAMQHYFMENLSLR